MKTDKEIEHYATLKYADKDFGLMSYNAFIEGYKLCRKDCESRILSPIIISETLNPAENREAVGEKAINLISYIVSEAFNVSLVDIVSKTRKRHCVLARQLIFYYTKKGTDLSLKRIGHLLFKMDPNNLGEGWSHATVLHGIGTVNDLIDSRNKNILDMIKYINLRIEVYSNNQKENSEGNEASI